MSDPASASVGGGDDGALGRQTRRHFSGHVRRGPPVGPASASIVFPASIAVPASIQSKFETTMHTAPRERDGFASRVVRFSERASDSPGPGEYHKEHSFTFSSDSISAKGYGSGFVSKDRRLSAARRTRTPGPGSYAQLNDTIGLRASTGGAGNGGNLAWHARERGADAASVPAQRTRAFAKPLENTGPPHRYRVQDKGAPTPGPGQYSSVLGSVSQLNAPCPTAGVFRSTSRRLQEDAAQKAARGNPGPDAYTLVRTMDAGDGVYAHRRMVESANFRSTSRRSWETYRGGRRANAISAVLVGDGGGGMGGGYGADAAGGGAGGEGSLPGPGSYHVGGDDIAAATVSAGRMPSSMFSKTNTTRFGAPVEAKINTQSAPGPGAYANEANTVKARVGKRSDKGGSQFMGGTDATDSGPLCLSPGPSSYTPKVIVKKSFHLNKSSRWI